MRLSFAARAAHNLFCWIALSLAAMPGAVMGEDCDAGCMLSRFESQVTEHTLSNGWRFVIVERSGAPVFSFSTFVNVGSAQEVPGITGLAHMFEHMAFKGSPRLGSLDWPAEQKAIEAMEAAYQRWQAQRLNGADAAVLQPLEQAFRDAEAHAQSLVDKGAFDELLEREGAVGINAFTNSDHTAYFYSLPANRFELFAWLESERFMSPVFREFYVERAVVQEERRMRTESQAFGRLLEQFQAMAFVAHPYKQPVVGYMSDLQSFTITDAQAFFDTHYAPHNMVTAIVGNMKASELIPVIDRYFGRIPAREGATPLRTEEPAAIAARKVTLTEDAQPLYIEGYNMPADTHPDAPIWEAMNGVFASGRTSRMYRGLVEQRRLAIQAGSLTSYPGGKYPSLWLVYAIAAPGVDNDAIAAAVAEEVQRLRDEPVSAQELDRYKRGSKAALIRSLQGDSGLAMQIAYAATLFGDWREIFRRVDRIDAVTAQDIQRVARASLLPQTRIVGRLDPANGSNAQ